ncbi:MAG: DUF222 domain-containing protein [Microthrixaceae bacterium]|nr:DUF222 domain-containing protein [Microthrixaceae bacterium]
MFDMVVGMDGGTTIMERPEAAVVGDWESRLRELDDRIGVLSAQIHALDAELVGVLAEYDAVGGWQGRGWRSFAHYLSVRTNFAPRDAERLVSIAARVDEMPSLLAAARGGQVSMGVLASAARVVTPENEARVLDVVRACTPRQAQRVLAAYRSLRPTPGTADGDGGGDGADGSVADDLELDHWWRNWIDDHGRYRIDGALDKLTGELLEQARRAVIAEMERTGTHPHADKPSEAGEPSDTAETTGVGESAGVGVSGRCVSAVESITAMASMVLEHASGTGVGDRGGERFAVQVVCDIAALAEALGIDIDANVAVGLGSRAYLPRTGAHLSNAELSRVLCEGTLQMLVDHDGQPLWLGTEKRLFNRHQRRALRHRAGGVSACEFPGCPTTRFVETHHIAGVAEDGGLTDLDNGVLLCSFHHHELHRKRWQIVRNGSQLTFYDRTRCLGSSGPPGPTPGPHADVAVLPHQTHPPEPPPDIGADSCRCHGGGEHLTAYALDELLHHLLTAA